MSSDLNEKEQATVTTEAAEVDGAYHVATDGEPVPENLKLAKDGKSILIPQPSDDPEDPLNWSWLKKHLVLLSLFFPSLLTDFGMTWGTTLYQEQAASFAISVPAVANSMSGGIFLQGPGGVFAIPFAERYGRLPCLFWSQVLSCVCVIGASQCTSYAAFTACRTLQGWCNTCPQVIGLTIVGDMFFFHERTIRVNIWAFSFILGPFFGPFLSALIVERLSWQATYGVLAGLYGFSAVMLILFGDETLYDRNAPQAKPKGVMGKIQKLTGVYGWKTAVPANRVSLLTVAKQIITFGFRPNVFAVTAGYFMILFMWAIGIVTTVSQFLFAPPYSFTPTAFALFFLGPSIGACVGELWGHVFNEILRKQYVRRHHGNFIPEVRLWGAYPSVLMAMGGLILFGETLQHSLTWFGLCFGWAMYVFAMVSGTTAVSSYLLDSYPHEAGIVSGVLNFWRTTGGFCVSYFQMKWVAHNGAAASFGTQAGILVASFGTIVLVQVFGRKWRTAQQQK